MAIELTSEQQSEIVVELEKWYVSFVRLPTTSGLVDRVCVCVCE